MGAGSGTFEDVTTVSLSRFKQLQFLLQSAGLRYLVKHPWQESLTVSLLVGATSPPRLPNVRDARSQPQVSP